MTSTTLLVDTIKSKWACPQCKAKNIINTCTTVQLEPKRCMVDSAPTMDESIHYHCLNCGYEFAENEDQKKMRERAAKDEIPKLPYTTGFLVTVLMLLVIGIIQVSNGSILSGSEETQDLFESPDRRELFLLREAS